MTNILSPAILPVAQISWPSATGVNYQPESTTNLAAGPWSTNFTMISGDGTTKSFLTPMTNSAMFLRLLIPPVVNNLNGVVWSTDFGGSSVIDPNTWTYDVGGAGWGNGQLEYDTAQHQNTYITNGNLVIEADRTNYWGNSFTSARMLTQGRFAFKYGNLEARIKIPNTANGLWPAFWMMGNNSGAIVWPDCGEVDIAEMGAAAGITSNIQQELIDCAIHYSDTNGNAVNARWLAHGPGRPVTQDYHLYQMSWTPTNITFSLDNVPFGSWDITNIPMFQQPMFLILNIAIGGYDPSYTGVYSPGAVTATFPATMDVDYIQVTDNGYTQLYFGDNYAETGNFGVFAGTTPVNDSLTYGTGLEPNFAYGTNAALYIWNNMTPSTNPPAPSEGTTCWSFDIAGGQLVRNGSFSAEFPQHEELLRRESSL